MSKTLWDVLEQHMVDARSVVTCAENRIGVELKGLEELYRWDTLESCKPSMEIPAKHAVDYIHVIYGDTGYRSIWMGDGVFKLFKEVGGATTEWAKKMTAYNNYDLIAANCADISEYRDAMQTQHPSDLYNLAHEIATIEDLAYHCEENCDNLDVTCRELWRVGLERLHALARTGDIPVTGDDWYNLMDECATRIKTTQKGQSQ